MRRQWHEREAEARFCKFRCPRPANQSVPNTSGSERLLAVAATLTAFFHRQVKNHFMYTMQVRPKQSAAPRLTAAALALTR